MALAAAGLAVVAGWLSAGAWVIALLAALLLLAIDARRLRALPDPEVERELPTTLPVGVEREVVLRLRARHGSPQWLDLHDHHPPDWAVAGLPQRLQLPPGRTLETRYRVRPTARGGAEFAAPALRLESPWALWRQRRRPGAALAVRVYPNFAPLAALTLVGAEQASRVIGAHLRRRRGEGTEFQQLREYRVGDSLRQIDWKATQRARRLISREYQDERNQQVLLVLDGGRRMRAQDGALAHFDHALNAALVLAYIALRQGDAVGLMAIGADTRFLPPQRGAGAIDRLLQGVYDLQPQAVATDYLEAAAQLGARQPRRALVVLLTNARDEDVEELGQAVRQLARRHLVCVASLRERVLDDTLTAPVDDLDAALRHAGSALYLEARQRAHAALRALGADVLDVTCEALPAALVEHYLAIKRAARL
jgi:uncharacterized protein (DUF58 family)